MKTALLVIDVQQSFYHLAGWTSEGFAVFQAKQTELMARARAAGMPVVGILHESRSTPAFFAATGWVAPMDWLPPADIWFTKRVHNALTDSGLLAWLQVEQIEKVIVSGMCTEQCCETTARVASDLVFAVDFVTEATHTFAITHANGTVYTPAQIKERTELVLADRFARIMTVEGCF